MGSCFERSRAAYASGDGAGAKSLSEEGHALQAEARKLAARLFRFFSNSFNTDRHSGPAAVAEPQTCTVQESPFTQEACWGMF